MIANIIRVTPDSREIVGWAETPTIDWREREWYEAVQKSCPSGGTCRVGPDYEVVSMLSLTTEKREEVLDIPGPAGIVLGLRIGNDAIWKGIEEGTITEFDLEFDHSGIQVSFPQPTAKSTAKHLTTEELNFYGWRFPIQ